MSKIRPKFLRHSIPRIFVCMSLMVSAKAGAPTGIMAGVSDAGPDATINLIMRDIDQNNLDVALTRTKNLLRIYPNFRLAQLIQGDLLLARTQPLTSFGDAPGAPTDKIRDLREEAIARLRGYRNRPTDKFVPRYLLQLRSNQNYAVVVDTKLSRLYVYKNENGRPVFIADWYVSQGRAGADKTKEGDLKTPVGVYHVTGVLSPKKIGAYYGNGAFPLNYPNAWDRMHGRSGHGIWLHGVPANTYARPPKASEGCVVLANQDLDSLSAYLQIGVTPVIISDGVEWLSLDSWQQQRHALDTEIEQWRRDWESMNTDQYLSHYSYRFHSDHLDYTAWAAQKRKVNASKTWVKVKISNISVLRNPGKQEMVMISFDQDYRSNNLNSATTKHQYWIKENGRWKIIYERSGS